MLLAAGGAWYAVYGDRSHPLAATQIVIERGATFDEIASRLAENGIESSALTLRALAKLRGQDVAVRAGGIASGRT